VGSSLLPKVAVDLLVASLFPPQQRQAAVGVGIQGYLKVTAVPAL